MKNTEKITASEMRTLWGEQSSNLDYHDSGAVPGSVDRNVLFFSR